ncbi:MAG: D-alanyl-D-alanine carboxypeptidase [Lachnospiraceae bacterium]|nr:D-alanyl-D-alanine carboxypeptidase [Lachnospiraceae bacterium]
MKKMKKIALVLALAAMMLLQISPAFAEQNGPDVHASGYCVMNMNTGEIVFQKNMDVQKFPASITKIMTAIVSIEACEDLNQTLTFSEYAVNSLTANSSTLSPKAAVGEQMTVEDALYGLMLCSANECGNALAEFTAGSIEQFAELMNQKAAQVGAVNTHFVNPHGLHDENHYTTPHDMALIFQYAMKNETFAKIVSTVNYTIPATNVNQARECQMTHQLVNGAIACEGVYAGKTGNTVEAGRTLVTAAKRHNVDLISVIMESDNEHFYIDTQILLDYAFGLVSGSYPNVTYTAVDDVVVTDRDVRIRELPSTLSAQVGSAMTGTQLHRIGTFAGWSHVETANGSFYISTDFLLTPEGSAVAAPYTTIAPTDAPETEAPTTEAETTTEEVTITAEVTEEPVTEETETAAESSTAQEQLENSATQHHYEVNEDVLMLGIMIIIALIAIVAGAMVAVLIIRRG